MTDRPPRRGWPGWLPWVALPVLTLPALWPYTQGWPSTADGWLHLVRLVVLDQHVKSGVFYPRWVPELVLGYGYPVFNFYGPATFFLAELLHRLGLGYYQSLMGTFSLLLLLGGFGMYLWARDVLDYAPQPWAALVAAVAYMYAPYFLTNIFVRGAIGEVGAQALLPWVFWSFRRVLRDPQPARYVLPAAVSLGGLAAAHNITLLLLPPALLGYLAIVWWTGGHSRPALVWMALSGLAAMGVGAFFWLPLIGERQYLLSTALDIARQVLPRNAWTSANFLDLSLLFRYTTDGPFRLGLVQAGLALAGFVLARRRDTEWKFLLVLAIVSGLGISAWTVPIWLSSDLLLVAQFPWRLLVLMSLPLSLLAGGLVDGKLPARWQPVIGLALVALIIIAQRPRLPPTSLTPPDNSALSAAAAAQFEVQTGALGTSSAREFFPRWAEQMALDPESAGLTGDLPNQVTLTQAGSYERVLTVTAEARTTLRFTDFYYPNWQAQLDGATQLAPYASTSMGLLTVDVPAGTHQLHIRLQDTPLERIANWLTLLTLGGLVLFGLRQTTGRWLSALPAVLLIAGGIAMLKPWPTSELVSQALPSPSTHGLRLLGYRIAQQPSGFVELYPYWESETHPARLLAHWQITALDGSLVSEIISEPYFNASRTDRWPAGTVVDDAYQLALPPGLPAGDYGLSLSLQPLEPASLAAPVPVGTLHLEAVPMFRNPVPAEHTQAIFGDSILLAGYDLALNGKSMLVTDSPLAVRAGDLLNYTLYWQARAPLRSNYHSLLHFIGANQAILIQKDQVAGSWFRAPLLWDPFHLQPETYRLQVPANPISGVYWPRLGLYHFDTLAPLLVNDSAGQPLGDTLALSPLKVVAPAPRPQHVVVGRIEDLAALQGYDLTLPPDDLRPGASLTLTVYYRSQHATGRDLTRFVHLYNAESGLAAQADSQPQQGLNPTWAWIPGEVILDRVVLTLAPATVPGKYSLQVGFYDPSAEDARLTAYDAANQPLPDGSLTLTDVQVSP